MKKTRATCVLALLLAGSYVIASTINGIPGQLVSVSTGEITGLSTIATTGAITDATGTALVTHGGTGQTTLTNHGILVGAGTAAITQLAVCGANTIVIGNAAADPSCSSTPTAVTLTLTKSVITGVNTITAGATPTVDLSLGNIQSVLMVTAQNEAPTFTNIVTGGVWMFHVCQPATGTVDTWTWPASVHGGMTIGTTLNKCNDQWFQSPDGATLYAVSGGVINQ